MSFWKKITGVLSGGVSDVAGAVLSGGAGNSGGGTSSSSTSDAQIGASENGQALQNSNAARDNGIVLGTNSSLNAGGVEVKAAS